MGLEVEVVVVGLMGLEVEVVVVGLMGSLDLLITGAALRCFKIELNTNALFTLSNACNLDSFMIMFTPSSSKQNAPNVFSTLLNQIRA
jgi:hypothetical protein